MESLPGPRDSGDVGPGTGRVITLDFREFVEKEQEEEMRVLARNSHKPGDLLNNLLAHLS